MQHATSVAAARAKRTPPSYRARGLRLRAQGKKEPAHPEAACAGSNLPGAVACLLSGIAGLIENQLGVSTGNADFRHTISLHVERVG